MPVFITSTLVAFGMLFSVLPSQVQYASNPVVLTKVIVVGSINPEEGAKSGSYKVVHGVVQGKQDALPGATVWLHGSRTIVATNAEGEFELRVPANAEVIELTCAYGGLQDEIVRLAPVQALGSVYMLRPKTSNALTPVDN